eukprot:3997714-Karenia_brevis.AAC.1
MLFDATFGLRNHANDFISDVHVNICESKRTAHHSPQGLVGAGEGDGSSPTFWAFDAPAAVPGIDVVHPAT